MQRPVTIPNPCGPKHIPHSGLTFGQMHFMDGPKPPTPPCRPNTEINMTSDTKQQARHLHRSCKSRVPPLPVRPSPCQASPRSGVSHSGESRWGNLQHESVSLTIRKSVRPGSGKRCTPPICPARQTSATQNARGTQSRRAAAKSARTRCTSADETSTKYRGHASTSHGCEPEA